MAKEILGRASVYVSGTYSQISFSMPTLQCFVDGKLLLSLGFWISVNLLIFCKPDDGSCVNRNMPEQILHFLCVFNNPTFHIIECINWTIKCLKCVYVSGTYSQTSFSCQICSVLWMVNYYRLLVSGLPLIFSYSVNNTKIRRINLVPASDGNMMGGDTCLDMSGKKKSFYSLVEISLFSVINDL